MGITTTCDCGKIVNLEKMNSCRECDDAYCEDCCPVHGEFCNACEEQMPECTECGEKVRTDEIFAKGRCFMCHETIID
jgi:hypothetical protein